MSTSLTHLLAALPEPLFSTYAIERVLGVGAYAIVYQIRSIETDEAFALKVVEKEPMRQRAMMPQLDREVVLLDAFSCSPHIIELLEVLHTSTHVFLRFELCEECVEDALDEAGPLAEEDAFGWFRQTCLGVQALHANGVIHRDLKPSNLLIDRSGAIRICDFGWACAESDQLSGSCGTPQYSPPECTGQTSYIHTTKVDIYGLGTCLQHILLGRVPMGPEDFPKGLSEGTTDLLHELLNPDPDLRPSIEDVLLRSELTAGSPFSDHVASVWRTLSDFVDLPALTSVTNKAGSKASKKKKTTTKKSLADNHICGFGSLY
jgi:serine/threonine protein kinase